MAAVPSRHSHAVAVDAVDENDSGEIPTIDRITEDSPAKDTFPVMTVYASKPLFLVERRFRLSRAPALALPAASGWPSPRAKTKPQLEFWPTPGSPSGG